jgi:hypothetical protein
MEQEEKVMQVKDLIAYLETLPQNAELFFYSGFGGFLSLDSMEDIEAHIKLNEKENTVYLDNARYEIEDRKRISQGKEWAELLREAK